MPIWEHKGIWKEREWLNAAWAKIKGRPMCLYCAKTYLDPLGGDAREAVKGASTFLIDDLVYTCRKCGWWFALRHVEEEVEGEMYGTAYGLSGNLLQLSSSEFSPRLATTKSELQRNWEKAKHDVSPRVFEDVVARVFMDFGYHTRSTGYSRDGGIDIVLARENDLAGVQVKRYRNRIKVEQIRAFAGALLLNGLPQGVFVTTSEFQAGCRTAADAYGVLGLPIELINGDEFLASLDINRRPPYRSWHDLFVDAPQQLTKFMAVRIC